MFGQLLCRRRGHDWFPNLGAREFIPTTDFCMRCTAERFVPPWGQCLGGHPMADHYPSEDRLYMEAEGCTTRGPS